ncbi:MAG: hypothetical protein UX89_C0020G0001 [Parcubacteria group bacterium GW2011_GWA2_47_16]|nr:MAG: hypothetical protein UX89_C0020G0001 [Parcubacteria group bacterium GW2011_GWA2_47_16]
MRKWDKIREQAIVLRVQGKTYPEIQNALGIKVPKGNLFYWFQDIKLTPEQAEKIRQQNLRSLVGTRVKAHAALKQKREKYLASVTDRVKDFASVLSSKKTAKVALAVLYITEGSKSQGSICFGNSDPYIISLFLHLLRFCYNIDEQKLRCTVQCRADQNIEELESFWMRITGVSKELFSKAQIDPRTVGKPTKKAHYKGVCRIQYYSADISLELRAITKVMHNGPIVQW